MGGSENPSSDPSSVRSHLRREEDEGEKERARSRGDHTGYRSTLKMSITEADGNSAKELHFDAQIASEDDRGPILQTQSDNEHSQARVALSEENHRLAPRT